MCDLPRDLLPCEPVPPRPFVPTMLVLRRTYQNNRVTTDKGSAKLSLDFAIDTFFCVVKDHVNMNVESAQTAQILPSVLALNNHFLIASAIQCIKWSCFHKKHPYCLKSRKCAVTHSLDAEKPET